MGLRIEGGGDDWGYNDVVTQRFEPMSGMRQEHLNTEPEPIWIAPYGGTDAVGIKRNNGDVQVTVYRVTMPGKPNIEVDFVGDVVPCPEKCPSLGYRLGAEATLFLSYGQMERVVIATS